MKLRSQIKCLIAFILFSQEVLSQEIPVIERSSFSKNTTINQVIAQKSPDANWEEYQKYIIINNRQKWSDAYLQTSEAFIISDSQIEKCLDQIYELDNTLTQCRDTFQQILSWPLNQKRSELFLLLFKKIIDSKNSAHEKLLTEDNDFQMYSKIYKNISSKESMNNGDFLSKKFEFPNGTSTQKNLQINNNRPINQKFEDMEWNSFKKNLFRKWDAREIMIFKNGIFQPDFFIRKNNSKDDLEINQWMFLTESTKPLIFIGNRSQFTTKIVQNSMLISFPSCEESKDSLDLFWGSIPIEFFVSPKCIIKNEKSQSVFLEKNESKLHHLSEAKSLVKINESTNQNWIWMGTAVVALGMFYALKDKNIEISFPIKNH